MKYGLRGLLVVLFLSGVASATVYWRFYKLPHPNQANQNQIAYWLVLKDVSRQPEEIQIALVDRLIDNTDILTASGSGSARLTAAQAERLRKNIEQLKYAWFADRVEKYQALPESRRQEFLRQQIQVVGNWATLMSENAEVLFPDSDRGEQIDYSAMLFDEVEHWLETTPPENHAQAYRAVADAVQCWLATEPLANQSIETRRELASRIARELNCGLKIDDPCKSLSADEQMQLGENCELLCEAWMYQLADDLDRVEDKRARTEFVDSLIKDVQDWGVLSVLPSKAGGGNEFQAVLLFTSSIEQWVKRAAPEYQEKLGKLYSLAKKRLAAMAWKQVFSNN